MSDDRPVPGPLRVLVALPFSLDAEAYAARIKREPGWRALSPADHEPWDVRLSDRCRLQTEGLEGTTDQGPTVVVTNPVSTPGAVPSCACCYTVPRGAAWPSLFRALAEAAGRPRLAGENDALGRLTKRELEVLRLVGFGKSVNECAKALGVTPSTIGNHKYRLMRKLRVSTSLQLLRIAVSNGLADLE